MHKFAACVVLLAALLLFSAFQDMQVRVEVEAVNLFVTVTDQQGRFITNLTKDRFIVYEDRVPQEISNFVQETNLPLRIGLLIDTSSSVRLKLDFEKDAAIRFVRSVMRKDDQALLVEFDEGVTLVHDFTTRPTAIVQSVKQLRAGGGTALWDAIYVVSREKMTDRAARKTLVVVSDGQDLSSSRSLDDALAMVQASEVTVFSIGTSKFGATQNKKGENALKEMSQETGGTAFFPYSADLLDEAFDLINQELRSQYSITYTPKNESRDGKFRKIEVRLKDSKGLKLRHKKGYWAPTEESS
jgi:VWFA-related protein